MAKKRVSTAEAIAKRNAAFAKLEPAAKRVQIAKDVPGPNFDTCGFGIHWTRCS